MNGVNYVPAPSYNSVRAFVVNSDDFQIPSGGTAVGGVYYEWGDSGFTNTGWYTELEGSPTNKFQNGKYEDNDTAFEEYLSSLLEDQRNLNAVFTEWQNTLQAAGVETGTKWYYDFQQAVYSRGGYSCAHIIMPG